MNTQQAMKAKSEWLVQCLSFGWEKDDLDSLSAVWDKFKDEYGNLKQSKPQSEPLPDSGGNKSIQQLIKMVETRMSLVDSLDDATPSDRARYDVYVDMLTALKETSTVSEATGIEKQIQSQYAEKGNQLSSIVGSIQDTLGEDAIGFVEWIDKEEWLRMLPENTWVKGMEKADDVDAENYYTTEQLYQLYRKQSKK